jgi:BirA family biotin operon repressor/biotin-[acetyl-CoA-carboxylase] ligase
MLISKFNFRGYSISEYDILNSTQDEAKNLIRNGEFYASKNIIITHYQINGRGRSGRQWESYQGNLMASIIVPYYKDMEDVIGYKVSLGIVRFMEHSGAKNMNIKWPNDVLINEKKVSGILLEKEADFVIIGIGVNITENPDNTDNVEATNMYQEGLEKIQPMELLKKIIMEIEELDKLTDSEIFDLTNDYLYKIGDEVSFNLWDRKIIGTLIGINDSGQAVIHNEGKDLKIRHGEIFIES